MVLAQLQEEDEVMEQERTVEMASVVVVMVMVGGDTQQCHTHLVLLLVERHGYCQLKVILLLPLQVL